MATASPTVSMAPTTVTNTNAGNNAQNAGPNRRSQPPKASVGMPTQGASITRAQS